MAKLTISSRRRRAPLARRQPTSREEVKNVVKSIIGLNLEHKRANLLISNTASSAGQVLCLSQFIIEGDGISQRTGRLINVTGLTLRYTRVVNSLTNNSSNLRTIVFLDTQNQGTFPAVLDVLTSANPPSGFEVNNAQQHRFRILHDTHESLSASSATHRKSDTIQFRPKFQIHYGGAADAAASNRKNAVFFLVITNNVLAGPDYDLGVQFEFTDA